MKIDRYEPQGGFDVALERIRFCLDQLEKASNFTTNINWDTTIVRRLTLEELIGALVSAGQVLENSAHTHIESQEKNIPKTSRKTPPEGHHQ